MAYLWDEGCRPANFVAAAVKQLEDRFDIRAAPAECVPDTKSVQHPGLVLAARQSTPKASPKLVASPGPHIPMSPGPASARLATGLQAQALGRGRPVSATGLKQQGHDQQLRPR